MQYCITVMVNHIPVHDRYMKYLAIHMTSIYATAVRAKA